MIPLMPPHVLILAAGVGLVVGVFISLDDGISNGIESILWWFVCCLLGIAVSTAVALFVVVIPASALSNTEMDATPSTVAALANLRSSEGISGRFFFLGSGMVGTEQHYFWYERSGDAVTPRSMRAGVGVYVVEQDRNDAVLQVYGWHYTRAWVKWLAMPVDGRTSYFYVPRGTVARTFSLQ